MNTRTCTTIVFGIAAAAAATALLLAGCGSLRQSYPDKTLYAIHIGDPSPSASSATTEPTAPPAPPAPTTQTASSKLVLRVDRVIIAEPFDATTFIYQVGNSTYKSDYYNGFVAPPSRLLTGEIATFIARSGLYATAFSGDTASTADFQLSLETNVTCFCADYRDESKPKAMIAARFFLIDQTHGRYVVIFDKTYSQSAPITEKGPDGLVKGWEAGWAELLTKLARDLRGAPVTMNQP